MNARVCRDFTFLSCLHFEDQFFINSYKITVWMDVLTENTDEQSIAMDRIKYFIEECLDNCIFCNINLDTSIVDNYIKAGLKICTLPEDPYDQIIAAVVLSKINAITEKRLYATEIKLRSRMSDDVEFFISCNESSDFLEISSNWYLQSNMQIHNYPSKHKKKDKVVELKKDMLDWTTVHLNWNDADNKNNGVVYLNLDK